MLELTTINMGNKDYSKILQRKTIIILIMSLQSKNVNSILCNNTVLFPQLYKNINSISEQKKKIREYLLNESKIDAINKKDGIDL